MLTLRLAYIQLQVDSDAFIEGKHWYCKDRPGWRLEGRLHILVETEGAARHHYPLRCKIACFTRSLKLIKAALEEYLLGENFVTVQVNSAIVHFFRLIWLPAWLAISSNLWLQAGINHLHQLLLLLDLVPRVLHGECLDYLIDFAVMRAKHVARALGGPPIGMVSHHLE